MKIQIKNYKSCRGNEGDAYSCTLHMDGKKAAYVEYAGTGGEVEFDFAISDGKMLGGPMSLKFDAFVKEHQMKAEDYKPGDENGEYFVYCGRDIVVEEFINDMLETRQLKRWCNKNVVYRHKGQAKGAYFQVPFTHAKQLLTNPIMLKSWRLKLEIEAAKEGKEIEEIVNERFAA